MAKAHGTASMLTPNSSSFLNPFGSHNLTSQSVKIVPRYGSSSSLQLIYKEFKACPVKNYVCRSQLGASFTPPDKIPSGSIIFSSLQSALKALQHRAALPSPIFERRNHKTEDKTPSGSNIALCLESALRFYGANPYHINGCGITAAAVQHHGKEMSCENYINANAAWLCVSDFVDPTCVIVKHMNPSGIASRDDILEAYKLAVKADVFASYGGIVAFNAEVNEALASQIREFRSPDGQEIVYQVVVAPAYSQKGLEILRGMSKDLRVLEAKKNKKKEDELSVDDSQFRTVSDKCPTKMELDDVKFAWRCVKHGMSNDVVLAKNKCMLGLGPGLPNYLMSGLEIAMEDAGEESKGAILASDAFFPSGKAWKEAVNKACESGVTAIVATGGSIGDEDAIQCCNNYGVSLLFTGVSHFRC